VKMLDELKDLQNDRFQGYGEKHNWTHKSCLWELPYAKALILPHNIDLMHQERNVAKNIISMCFDVTDLLKDNIDGLKSHDYHILKERLMSVIFHGYFNANLWKIFTELSYFFYRQICAKQVSKAMM
jgi:hypothetical protein